MLKAEETSAGKEVKARKQKRREMNYAKLNTLAIHDVSENTRQYFVWHIKKQEEKNCLMDYETLHISKVRELLLWICAFHSYRILLVLVGAISYPLV